MQHTMENIKISVITSLYKCAPFLESFLLHYSKIDNLQECELVIIHNDPTEEEIRILEKGIQAPMRVHHIKVGREGLYASWNRGIKLAKGKYIAVWNVDDIRTPGSLSAQKLALDNSDGAICYGDFYGTGRYGTYNEKLYSYGEFKVFEKEAFSRHIIGCFPMWRKEIHEQVGYFDEQFRLVSDYEFQLRVVRTYPLVKAQGLLGYYLEHAGHKLSSNRNIQTRERTVVQLRYRMYTQILLHFLPSVFKYRINYVNNFEMWLPLTSVVSEHKRIKQREIISLIKMPVFYINWFIKRSFHAIYTIIFQ